MGSTEAYKALMQKGQAQLWQHIFAFAESMALKCVVELRVADIIQSHGVATSLSQIAAGIDSPSPNIPHLSRIMRLLVRKGIFSAHQSSTSGETLYGLTDVSRCLLSESELDQTPLVLMQNHELVLAAWHRLAECVKEGGNAFVKAHGCELFDLAAKNPEFNKLFNDAMTCSAKGFASSLVVGYKDGLASINGSLMDVGGGSGELIANIIKEYPHIKGVNFDMPHVIATAPAHKGVYHLEGDMFVALPKADAIIMQRILHSFDDEDCIKILRNCLKAIPKKGGKLIVVDHVREADGTGAYDAMGVTIDLLMMTLGMGQGGKQRTATEWKKLIEKGGFSVQRIIGLHNLPSVIEAFPA